MREKEYELTRRKILAGAGTVGAAGAAAGLGTSALFTDEESFANNSITAGTLNMSVTAEMVAANDEYLAAVGDSVLDYAESADGEVGVGFTLDDFKPGDWVLVCIDITILDNPGCVTVFTENLRNDDNGLTEPEENEAGDTTGGDGEGELAQNLVAEVYHGYTGSGGSVSGNPRDNLIGLDSTTPAGTTLDEFHDTYNDDENSSGVTIGGSPGLAVNNVVWYLLLELPRETTNVVQSDSVAFDARFDSVQARNNEGCMVSFDGVRAATERYHDVSVAEEDGYHPEGDGHCVEAPPDSPFEGAMGVHYANPALIGDDTVNQLQPEVLVYEPDASGDLTLVAVEYISESPFKLFGQESDPPGAIPFHSLHAWIWKENPAGPFVPFNPDVSCPD